MAKFGGRLVMWLFVGIKMADGSKKLSSDTLFLTESDNKGIATSFYSKRQRRDRRMEFYPNS